MTGSYAPTRDLWLIRHGSTAWNEAGRYQGRADTKLSARGEWEMRHLAGQLARLRLCAILTSPLRRARQSACLLAGRLGAPIRVAPSLTELDYGDWEGLTQAEVKQLYPEHLRCWKTTPQLMAFPTGETLLEAETRLREFLAGLADASLPGEGALAVVTHEAMIRLACLMATGRELAAYRTLRVATGTACHLVWHGSALRMAGDGRGERDLPRIAANEGSSIG